MSICFARECATGFFESVIQPWLLAWMTVVVEGGEPRLVSSERSHTASLVAFAEAIYSASTVDRATVGCFFDDQETVLPATSKMKPAIERQSSASCAQSESVHPTRSTPSFLPPNTNPC